MIIRDFQARVLRWIVACLGPESANDATERNHRFLEESLELVQACGCTASEAHQLVDYVFGRPVGEIEQEAGGVAVTLAALLCAKGVDLDEAAEKELVRINSAMERIREKQAAKPKHSPLPGSALARASYSVILGRTDDDLKYAVRVEDHAACSSREVFSTESLDDAEHFAAEAARTLECPVRDRLPKEYR